MYRGRTAVLLNDLNCCGDYVSSRTPPSVAALKKAKLKLAIMSLQLLLIILMCTLWILWTGSLQHSVKLY